LAIRSSGMGGRYSGYSRARPGMRADPRAAFRMLAVAIAVTILALASIEGRLVSAEAQYPKATGYVNDYAGVLSAGDKSRLEALSAEIEERTSAQVVVVVVSSTRPETSKTYAVKLFEKWGVGRKGKDNGVLILLDMEQRRIEVETGYGLEGVLTDSRVGEILDRDVVPQFKNGKFGDGLYAGVKSLYGLVSAAQGVEAAPGDTPGVPGAPGDTPGVPGAPGDETRGLGGLGYPILGIVLVFVGVMLVAGMYGRITRRLGGYGAFGYWRRCPKCRGRLHVTDKIVRRGSMLAPGLAAKVYTCPSCGFCEEEEYQTRPPVIGPFFGGPKWPGGTGGVSGFGGGRSSGGFGGFGGGRSGGGGAGRSW